MAYMYYFCVYLALVFELQEEDGDYLVLVD